MWAHILLLYCFDQSSVFILIIIIISVKVVVEVVVRLHDFTSLSLT